MKPGIPFDLLLAAAAPRRPRWLRPSSAGIGFGEAELTVFQEFFVEPSPPVAATHGEELPLKVDVFNYLESEQEVALTHALRMRQADHVVGDDPYSLSIGTVALRQVAGFEVPADAMLTRLLELASDESVGLHREPYPVEQPAMPPALHGITTSSAERGRERSG